MRSTGARFRSLVVGIASFAVCLGLGCDGQAAEGGSGVYLLGSRGSLAGIAPPPGTYLLTDYYVYSGDASANIALPTTGGELALGLDADAFVSMTTLLHSTRYKIFGGRLAFGAVVPIVKKDVSATATLDLGGGAIGGRESDDVLAFGDPLLTAIIGWDSGHWHATFNSLLNLPIGQYSEGALANAGFNRWAYDATFAVTYLDPTVGTEFTFAPGFTFNGANLDTDYRTGTEFHLEVALMQHLSPNFAIGLAGYHYQQVTGDSGTAPQGFKGQVTAIGPAINFNFQLGALPVSGKAKFYHEFNVENRTEGNAGFLQLAIPLSVPAGPMPPLK